MKNSRKEKLLFYSWKLGVRSPKLTSLRACLPILVGSTSNFLFDQKLFVRRGNLLES